VHSREREVERHHPSPVTAEEMNVVLTQEG